MVCTEEILVKEQNYITRYISPFSPRPEILLRLLKKLILIVQKNRFFHNFLSSLRFSLFFAHVRSRIQLILQFWWPPNSLFSLACTASYHLALPLVERRKISCLRHCARQHFLSSFLHSTSVEEVSLIFHLHDQYRYIERYNPFPFLLQASSCTATWWGSQFFVTVFFIFCFLLLNYSLRLNTLCSCFPSHTAVKICMASLLTSELGNYFYVGGAWYFSELTSGATDSLCKLCN